MRHMLVALGMLLLGQQAGGGTARAQAPATPGPAGIVAQAGGQTLTRQNLDELLTIYDWLLESRLGEAEKAALDAILVDEFRATPAKAAQNYAAIHQQLPQLVAASATQQARRRAEIWKGVVGRAASDAPTAAVLKVFARHPSVLLVTDKGVVTQSQIDALVASDDNVAAAAGLPKTSAAERARIAGEIVAAFPGLDPKKDQYEAIADAEERCFSLQAFVESTPERRAAVVAEIKAKVHGAKDVPVEARLLENQALLVSRMQQFAVQQKIIYGVVAQYQAQINAIREASDRFSWHESRAYQHGEAKPGPRVGLAPD